MNGSESKGLYVIIGRTTIKITTKTIIIGITAIFLSSLILLLNTSIEPFDFNLLYDYANDKR